MKLSFKKLFALCLCALPAVNAVAGTPLMGVERVRWWDPDYLTVTWSGSITPDAGDKSARSAREYIVSLLDAPTQADQSLYFRPADTSIPVGTVVLAVDGADAKGWTSQRFYSAMEGRGPHTLKLSHPGKGEWETEFGADLPAWITGAGFHPAYCTWKNTPYNVMSDRFKIRMDKDAPWKSFKTYDYYFSSDDVLADKELFDTICNHLEEQGLKRDENNPDVVFTVVKDASQSVEYNYVPETVERVQTGSVSTPVYGWKGSYLGTVTSNKYQTVKSGGYTQKNATTTVYLEVDFLEASRLGQKTLPLIWQMKYNYNENTQANVDQIYSAAVTWVKWPINNVRQEKVSSSCSRFFYEDIPLFDFGIILGADGTVIGLDRKSDVVKKSGIRIGDVLVGIDVTQSKTFSRHRSIYYGGTLSVERAGALRKLSFSRCSRTKFFPPIQFAASYSVF